MENYTYITLRERPELREAAAQWFHCKWGIPAEAYLTCMDAYLTGGSEYGWYLCLSGGRIVGGLGVIENDFHDRKDLSPNVCAVYTEEGYRRHGIAGCLLHKTSRIQSGQFSAELVTQTARDTLSKYGEKAFSC